MSSRIAEVLSRRRPDIPLLLVEGAGKASFLPQLGIDLSGVKNLRIMPNTPDPRQFYAVTKLLLMPSLMENAGFVAMEAMTNGIPVLASNRGGLPETIGNSPHPNPLPEGEGTSGGFLFDIPARYTPETRDLPTAEEVEPWVETIIRLWDDRGRVRACEPGGARACPAMASRPPRARLSRVLQPSHASARPAAGAEGSRQNMTSARGNKTAANRAQVTLDSSRVGRVERVPPSKVVHRRKMVGLAPLGPPYHYACSAPIPVRAAKLSQQEHCQLWPARRNFQLANEIKTWSNCLSNSG